MREAILEGTKLLSIRDDQAKDGQPQYQNLVDYLRATNCYIFACKHCDFPTPSIKRQSLLLHFLKLGLVIWFAFAMGY